MSQLLEIIIRGMQKWKLLHELIILHWIMSRSTSLMSFSIVNSLRNFLLSVKPENRFKHKVCNAKSTENFFTLCSLQVVNLHVQQATIELRHRLS